MMMFEAAPQGSARAGGRAASALAGGQRIGYAVDVIGSAGGAA